MALGLRRCSIYVQPMPGCTTAVAPPDSGLSLSERDTSGESVGWLWCRKESSTVRNRRVVWKSAGATATMARRLDGHGTFTSDDSTRSMQPFLCGSPRASQAYMSMWRALKALSFVHSSTVRLELEVLAAKDCGGSRALAPRRASRSSKSAKTTSAR
jgi:hypothetical protein